MSEAGREAQSALENLGNSGHDLLKSMVESGASADVVKAKQAELAKQFLATADSMGIPADAAQRLQQIYGLTPEEVTTLFKAETEQTKTALTQYLSNLRAIFPGDGNTAVFQTILEGINSGAITSMDQSARRWTSYARTSAPTVPASTRLSLMPMALRRSSPPILSRSMPNCSRPVLMVMVTRPS